MANEYKVKIIGEKTYAIEEKSKLNQGLCYLLCGDEKALLIDTGFGYPSLKNTVNNLTELPIIVADTHAHVDHIGGNHYFEEIWFHEKDKETFKKHCNPKYTLDTLTDGLSIIIKPIYKILMKKRLSIDSQCH